MWSFLAACFQRVAAYTSAHADIDGTAAKRNAARG